MIDPSVDPVLLTHESAEVLVLLRHAIDKLDLEFSRLAAEFDQEMYWDHEGANSGIDWIRHNCHMTSNAAADRIAVGKRADDLVESVQSMNQGDIGFAHLTVMTRTANAVGDAFDEKKLLGLAKEHSPGKFHYQCLHYRHAVDPRTYAEEQAGQVHGNELHMNRQDDGSFYLVGMLIRSVALNCAAHSSRWRNRWGRTTIARGHRDSATRSSSWPRPSRRSRCR